MKKVKPRIELDNIKQIDYWEKEWVKSAKSYTKMFDKRFKNLIHKLCLGRVCDLGCGIGLLGKYVKDYTGVDFSKEGLKIAKKNVPHGIFHQIDLGKEFKLPYKNEHFDTVVMTEIVEHLPDFSHLLKEAKRVCRRKIIITLPMDLWAVDHFHPVWTASDCIREFSKLGKLMCLAKLEGNFWLMVLDKISNTYYYAVNKDNLVNKPR